jgi:hypothetical protein
LAPFDLLSPDKVRRPAHPRGVPAAPSPPALARTASRPRPPARRAGRPEIASGARRPPDRGSPLPLLLPPGETPSATSPCAGAVPIAAAVAAGFPRSATAMAAGAALGTPPALSAVLPATRAAPAFDRPAG